MLFAYDGIASVETRVTLCVTVPSPLPVYTMIDLLEGLEGHPGFGKPALTMARSGTPSLLKSATVVPVGLQTLSVADRAKDPFAWPSSSVRIFPVELPTAMSVKPSPLKSPPTARGFTPTGVRAGGLKFRLTLTLVKFAFARVALPAVWSRNERREVSGDAPVAVTFPVNV